MPIDKVFVPWRIDYWAGITWGTTALAGGTYLLYSAWYWLAPVFCLLVLPKIWLRVTSGLAREQGVEVERAAVTALVPVMQSEAQKFDTDWQMTRYGVCIGNIDVVFNPTWSTVGFCIEIKSYPSFIRRWYGLCRSDKPYRLWSPIKQVRNQCRYLGKEWYFPVLWAPKSKKNEMFYEGDILVVNGDARCLMKYLHDHERSVKKPMIVKFPGPPGDSVTATLRRQRFIYDGNKYQWYGTGDESDAKFYLSAWNRQGVQIHWQTRAAHG